MCEKVNFNVIEKNKYDNIDDITKFINKTTCYCIMRLYKMSSLPIGG